MFVTEENIPSLETIRREQQGSDCTFLKEPNLKCQELSPSACCVQDLFFPRQCVIYVNGKLSADIF